MALPIIGRKVKLYQGDVATGTVYAGVTSKTATFNSESVDITNDDDSGWRTLLDEAGVKSMDLSVEGVVKDESLFNEIISGNSLTGYELDIETVGVFASDFRFTSVEIVGATADAVRFTASLQSSGAVTYTTAA